MRTKLKVCCIESTEDAQMAVHAGADILGLVGQMPSGPGVIDDEEIAEIVRCVPEHIWTFLLTSEDSVDSIVAHWQRTRTSHIQLVRPLAKGILAELSHRLPDIPLVAVVHIEDHMSVERARLIEPYSDYILLDSGRPSASKAVLGGTGKTHNWEISRLIAKNCTKPVFLAGGLHADNVQAAITRVNPYGVDVCSGVRTDHKLDASKLRRFVKNLKGSSRL